MPRDHPPVSLAGRALDLIAVLFLIGGGFGYFLTHRGLDRLRLLPEAAFTPGMQIDRLAQYHRLSALSWVALGAVAVGVGCGITAWFLERRRRRAAVSEQT